MVFVNILEPQIEIIHKKKVVVLYRCIKFTSYKMHIGMENRSTKKLNDYDTICKSSWLIQTS